MSGSVFKRYEYKYMLTREQYEAFLAGLSGYMQADQYGETTILSLYYDTKNNYLIRRSMEKPFYKEKLRLRSYGLAKATSKVFLELKKKYDGIVYKRRITLTEEQANAFIQGGALQKESQIGKEIRYFCDFYGDIRPAMLILYDRTAYFQNNSDLRITFDRNIRYRKERLSLHEGTDGIKILPNGYVILEIKTSAPYPAWLLKLLGDIKIYKTSFSKYGTAYIQYNTLQEVEKVG